MFKIIIVSHGELAPAFLKSAEMFTSKQDNISTFCLYAKDSPDTLKEKIEKQLIEWKDDDVVLLSDIRSGTPFNVSASLMSIYKFRHISGINLAMLVELITSRDYMSGNEACDSLMKHYMESILDVNTLL